MTLVDSHCHLDFPDFADEADAVVSRAAAAGIGRMVTICTALSRLDRTLDLTARHESVFGAVGVHPHEAEAEGAGATVERLAEIAALPKIVGIGETGLDFFYDHSPRDLQETSFRNHIRAARATGLPLIVHTRNADADTLRVLREEGAGERDQPLHGLIHCFSADRHFAEVVLDFGFYISFSGILTFPKSDGLRAVARELPLDRLLVETDAPYLAPVPRRGKRNEPALVVHTAARLAELKDVSPAELARRTTANFHTLFTRVPPVAAAAAAPAAALSAP